MSYVPKKPVVGQRVWLGDINSEALTPGTVRSVGRKYFRAVSDDLGFVPSSPKHEQFYWMEFNLDSWRPSYRDNTYCRAFESKEHQIAVRVEEDEAREVQSLRNEISRSYLLGVPLASLRKIKALIDNK